MTKKSTKQSELSPAQEQATFRIALAVAIGASLVSIYYFLPSTGARFSFFSANIQLGLLSIVWFLAALIARKGRAKTAVILMLSTANLALIIITLRVGGLDILFAMLIVTATFGIANLTLPPRDAKKAIYSSFFIAFYFFFIYFVEPFERLQTKSSNTTTWIIAGLFLLAFLILIFRQFHTYALRSKLILVFIFLNSLFIGISFTLISINMRDTLTASAQEKLFANASISAKNIENFLTNSIDSIDTASASLDLRSYLLLSPKTRTDSLREQQAQYLLFTLANSNADILSYGILDLNGMNILDSDSRNIGKSEAEYDYFQRPLNANNKYISPVLYFPGEEEGVLFFSVPVIYNDPNVVIGILRAKYRASVLQKLISTEKSIGGEESFSVLFDSNHIILAHGSTPSLIGKTTYPPSPNEIKSLRENFFLPSHLADDELSHDFKEIEEGLTNFVTTPYFSSEKTELGEAVSGAVTQLETVPWLVISAQPNDIFLAPVEKQLRRIIIAALVLIILAIFSGVGLADILVAPIIRLENTAQEFIKGNLSAKASIDADDEIGSLASTFNTLSLQLGETIESLESRVEKRTKDLETRTIYLEGAAEVSHAVGSITNPELLITEVVELIKKRFDLYYAGLFLVDKKNEWAILRAGTGEAGQKMLRSKHKIKIGEGMIGWSVANAESRIALDVGEDAVRFENPDLPETRSEGALPLRSRGRVLGALTVQSAEEAAFDQGSITALQTMADQIALALDNAELFAQNEETLDAERRAYGEISQRSWRALTQSQVIPRYLITAEGDMHPIPEPQAVETSQALHNKEIIQRDGLTAIIPITSRGFVVGGIKIRKNADSEAWTDEQVALAETLSEQLSVALESARLYDQAQRKAQREAVISEIEAKIGSSMRMDTILRTTVQELGQALGSPEVTFELTDPEKDKTS